VQRRGWWCSPEGGFIGSKVLVHCCWASRAITSDHRRNEGANGARLMALNQRLLDATTEETETGEACSSCPKGEKVWWGSSIIGKRGKIIQEDHEFIVTRATIAIALHLLHTDPPSDTAVSLGPDYPHDL
jgi:hypothetical protein